MTADGDGWKNKNVVGVAERDPRDTKENPFNYLSFDDDETDKTESLADQSRQRAARRRKRIAGASLFLLALLFAGTGLWMLVGSKTRVNVPVRDNAQRSDQASHSNDDATAQAIAEVRSATTHSTPTASVSAAPGITGQSSTIVVLTTPVTVPMEGVSRGVSATATEATTGQQGSVSRTQAAAATKSMEIGSERNPERSIRCAPTPVPVIARQPVISAPRTRSCLSPQRMPFSSMPSPVSYYLLLEQCCQSGRWELSIHCAPGLRALNSPVMCADKAGVCEKAQHSSANSKAVNTTGLMCP